MKTLVFCTSYAGSASTWDLRYRLWADCLRTSSLHFDQLLIVDDASPTLPAWSDIEILDEMTSPNAETTSSASEVVLYHHRLRLGRQSIFEFPGWYRSFVFGVQYGIANNYEKIVHVESDMHLISSRICDYINQVDQAWIAFWSRKYSMPEIAIQVAAGAYLTQMADFVSRPYSEMEGRNHEVQFPFSHVEKEYKGDRYGEDLSSEIPSNADYSAQTLIGKDRSYYWWLDGKSRALTRQFQAPFAELLFQTGWASPDATFVWMEGFESQVVLPDVDISEFHAVEFGLSPCIFAEHRRQRVFILINNEFVREVSLERDALVRCDVLLLDRQPSTTIRFIHPDAFVPCEAGEHCESRKLSLALSSVTLSRQSGINEVSSVNPSSTPSDEIVLRGGGVQ